MFLAAAGIGRETQSLCHLTYRMFVNLLIIVTIELSSRDVIPLDGANIPVPTAFNCIETAIGKS